MRAYIFPANHPIRGFARSSRLTTRGVRPGRFRDVDNASRIAPKGANARSDLPCNPADCDYPTCRAAPLGRRVRDVSGLPRASLRRAAPKLAGHAKVLLRTDPTT